jgi:hypothetical protein
VEIEVRCTYSLSSLKGFLSKVTIFLIFFFTLDVKTSKLISSKGEDYFFGAAAQAPAYISLWLYFCIKEEVE